MTTSEAFTAVATCLLSLSFARPGGAQENPSARFKVGFQYRTFTLDQPYNWRGAKTHGLITTVWYPASADAVEEPQWIGDLKDPLFSAGKAAPNAPMVS